MGGSYPVVEESIPQLDRKVRTSRIMKKHNEEDPHTAHTPPVLHFAGISWGGRWTVSF